MRFAPPTAAVLLALLFAASEGGAARGQGLLPDSQALAPVGGLGGAARQSQRLERWSDPHWRGYITSTAPADALNLFAEVVTTLGRLYVDREAARPDQLFAAGLAELALAMSDENFALANLEPGPPGERRRQIDALAAFAARGPASPAEARQLAFDLVRQLQVRLGVKRPSAIVFELIAGACAGLDDYTSFTPPVVTRSAVGEFFAEYGLTARVGRDHDHIKVEAVGSNHSGGFKPGDRIATLNGTRVAGLLADPAGRALTPPPGIGHALTLVGGESRTLPAELPELSSRFDDARPGVAVVRLSAFRPDTARRLGELLVRLSRSGMRSLVLDLRGNGGGSFPAALEVAGLFLGGGALARTDGQSPEFAGRSFDAPLVPVWPGPLVVLVDGGTASAAEVVAASLKERGRATLVGTRTFGKGVVQSGPIPLQSGTLVVTLARVQGPTGPAFDRAGIAPDVAVEGAAAQLEMAAGR